jgi:hypothetical protein
MIVLDIQNPCDYCKFKIHRVNRSLIDDCLTCLAKYRKYFSKDILCIRENGQATVNIPHWLINHSPSGYNWGYLGSGPAELALNLILLFGKEEPKKVLNGNGLYQLLKDEIIAMLPVEE